ncbi:C4-dicarboxylate ABC transporter permease [Corynebacterium yudongzhengii]|uniref:TRAP transporter large permease n=1 Tax=Corynebacterium yudongzhengii TaxID=2080740 RepID=A0A2U1T437_9CORY|nr:TRAP transporter large permease [Corynebacterium yudongzhengii]AWB82383.1 C4-dicarboxylate ABC transporter permease [Corynebacterium yudongzhengii]PWC00767.1 TRAP transporter large permease [Corynebacterium yudongzhengii]
MIVPTWVIVTVVLALFLGLLAVRLHVGLALALTGGVGVVLIRGMDASTSAIANQPYSVSADFSLTVIPLFILMGVFAIRSGLADAGFCLASALLRRLPGGPALASLAGSGLFAAVTGSSVATVATMAKVSTNAIRRAGLNIRLAAGVVGAGGTLGVLIPPSIILVLYGVVTGESIGELLLAGIGPGLLTLLAYAVTAIILVVFSRRRRGVTEQEDLCPGEGGSTKAVAEDDANPYSARTLIGVGYLAVIFGVSIGTIYAGLATPTEAASLGAMAALIVLLLRIRPPKWARAVKDSLTEAIGLTSMTFLLMFGAGVFTYFLALSGITSSIVEGVLGAEMNPYLVLIICLLLLLPLGMFLDGISMILIATPLLHPILTGYGFEGIWIGILIVKVAEMALITPPVGMNAFVYAGSVPQAQLSTVFRGLVPFILADIVVVAILIMAPDIVTFLPEMSSAAEAQ